MLVLLAIGVSYMNPAVDLLRSHESASEARQNLEQLAAENQRLQERAESVRDQSVLTREARRQGMVLPGERPYVVRDLGG